MAILKVLSRHSPSYGGLIEYLTREGKSKNGKPTILTHNFKGADKQSWTKELVENESFRRFPKSTQIFLYHTIISLSDKENKELITDDVLKDLANQYITLRGQEGMYLLAFHDDKEHQHIHVLESGVKYCTGMAHRLSHKDLHELKIRFQEYHKEHYPFLTHSLPEHGKGKDYIKDSEYYGKEKRSNVKETIKQQVQELFNQANSQQHFLQLLQENNLNHYERNGKATGIVFEDMKFRFSRLDIGMDEKPIDQELSKEEQQVLDEINEMRNTQIANDLER